MTTKLSKLVIIALDSKEEISAAVSRDVFFVGEQAYLIKKEGDGWGNLGYDACVIKDAIRLLRWYKRINPSRVEISYDFSKH
jgi:hypothetical protein